MLMLLAIIAISGKKQWVGLDRASLNSFLVWAFIVQMILRFPLSRISFENDMKQDRYACSWCQLLLDVSAGHCENLWNVTFMIATWHQKHLFGFDGKLWIPLHAMQLQIWHDDHILWRASQADFLWLSSLFMDLFNCSADIFITFHWIKFGDYLHACDLIGSFYTKLFSNMRLAQSNSWTQLCRIVFCNMIVMVFSLCLVMARYLHLLL